MTRKEEAEERKRVLKGTETDRERDSEIEGELISFRDPNMTRKKKLKRERECAMKRDRQRDSEREGELISFTDSNMTRKEEA